MTTTEIQAAPDAGPAAAAKPGRRAVTRAVRITIDLLVVAIVAVLLLAPGIDRLPLTDRDEARFAQATRQMVESGDWLDIRFQEAPRYKKPIGIYWLQGLAVTASGESADAPLWVYRLPSLAGAVLAVLLAYGVGLVLGGPTAGLIGAVLFASTILLGVEARLAKTDAVLTATVLMAQLALASAYLDPQRAPKLWRTLLFFGGIGLGVLVKGPLILLVSGLTLAVLMIAERSWSLLKALQPLIGIPFALAIVLPWLVAIGVISEGAFFQEAIGRDLLSKVASGQESHGAPPGAYLLVGLVTFWPAIAFVPAGIAWLIGNRGVPPARFLIAWALPVWIVLELVPTKLPHYVLPLLPALTIAAGLAIRDGTAATRAWWTRTSHAWLAVLGVLLAIALPGAFVFVEGRADPLSLAVGVIAGALAILAWRLAAGGRLQLAVAASVVAAGVLAVLAYVVVLPAARSIWLTDEAAATAVGLSLCPDPVRISVGYGEPSMVFRFGRTLRILGPEDGAEAFAAAPCALAIVDQRNEDAFVSAATARGTTPQAVAEAKGRNLNGFRERTLRFFVKSDGAF